MLIRLVTPGLGRFRENGFLLPWLQISIHQQAARDEILAPVRLMSNADCPSYFLVCLGKKPWCLMFYQARDIDNYREIIEDVLLLPLMFLLFCYVKCIGYSMHFKNYT